MSCEKCPYDDNCWCSFEGVEIPNDAECFIEERGFDYDKNNVRRRGG